LTKMGQKNLVAGGKETLIYGNESEKVDPYSGEDRIKQNLINWGVRRERKRADFDENEDFDGVGNEKALH